jgi:hypothetical protein
MPAFVFSCCIVVVLRLGLEIQSQCSIANLEFLAQRDRRHTYATEIFRDTR